MWKMIIAVVTLWLAGWQPPAKAADLPSYPFVHVSGSAKAYAVPDIGEIEFEVSVDDSDPERARTLVEERLTAVRALLATHEVPDGDVAVRDIRRDMPKGESAVQTYRLKCNVRIKVRLLASWAQVVTGLLAMPNLDEFGVAFDLTDRAKVEAELMAQALTDARRKGSNMANGVGRKLGLANGVSIGDVRNVSRALGLAAVDFERHQAAANVTSDRAGLAMISVLEFQQNVDVLFALK